MKKSRKSKATKKARLSKRQRWMYLSLLKGIKNANNNFVESYFWFHDWRNLDLHNLGWVAYVFAKRWGGRKEVDVKKLQSAVIKYGTAKNIYCFARDIPEANINRLQFEILKKDDVHWIKIFAKNIPNAKKNMLEKYILIAEIMNSLQ